MQKQNVEFILSEFRKLGYYCPIWLMETTNTGQQNKCRH